MRITPLEIDLRKITNGSSAARIARALRRTKGINSRKALMDFMEKHPYHEFAMIGETYEAILDRLIKFDDIELPAERLALVKGD